MCTDVTLQLRDAVLRQAQAQNLTEEQLNKLRSAHILRALSRKSAFQAAAADVARTVQVTGDLCRRHRRDFLQLHTCTEAERDRIEAEIGQYIKACTANIAKLESAVRGPDDVGASPAADAVNASTAAHYHGVCLILSERLQQIGRAFDHCRGARYQQLMRQRDKARAAQARAAQYDRRQTDSSQGSGWPGGQQIQATSDAENAALQQQLLATSEDVARLERSMRDIATLNQMFSAQVVHQSEQIEHIYSKAVEASMHVTKGNIQLRKALRHSQAARKYVLVLLLAASFGLLFLDWFYSGRLPKAR
mmetsp:Transcript_684/g.1984  ORF Transcript_684/g.1984 Transcript_684/m.1984 type:complete len:306 (+) Transcript_684:212-1129(+)|eukprot:CAMPEP_0206148298 /NCGR_PEP_ID=MMETSP1473-20131121/36218_1 /ASSEMBLY_ACC=CAM_ASM_001109 /TAXON_ID=1461547 /ORGANISM="Stichococcus sp, Strain RCC1054" /LENGTH=305 /DNA_ID=CAMNT_0053545589 /DNA_START=220 /DNA_END=1137 /DNA_ORIENTATION=+